MADYVVRQPVYGYSAGTVVVRVVNTLVGIIEILLGVRLVLELFGASPSAPFVAWMYDLTGALVSPFAGAFPNWIIGGFILDVTTLFAMVGYAIVGWLFVQLFSFIFVRV